MTPRSKKRRIAVRLLIPLLSAALLGSPAPVGAQVKGFMVVIDKTESMNTPSSYCSLEQSRCLCAVTKAKEQIDSKFDSFPGSAVLGVLVVKDGNCQVTDFSGSKFTTDRNAAKAAVEGSCSGLTPLADSICVASEELRDPNNFTPPGIPSTRNVIILSSGGESSSDPNHCGGPGSLLAVPPFSEGSWEYKAWASLNTSRDTGGPVVDLLKFFREGPTADPLPGDLGDQSASPGGVLGPFEFMEIAVQDTGGTVIEFADQERPLEDIRKAPILPGWSRALFVLLLLSAAALLAQRRGLLLAGTAGSSRDRILPRNEERE